MCDHFVPAGILAKATGPKLPKQSDQVSAIMKKKMSLREKFGNWKPAQPTKVDNNADDGKESTVLDRLKQLSALSSAANRPSMAGTDALSGQQTKHPAKTGSRSEAWPKFNMTQAVFTICLSKFEVLPGNNIQTPSSQPWEISRALRPPARVTSPRPTGNLRVRDMTVEGLIWRRHMGMLGLLKKEPDESTAPPEEPAPLQNDSSAVPRKRTVTDRNEGMDIGDDLFLSPPKMVKKEAKSDVGRVGVKAEEPPDMRMPPPPSRQPVVNQPRSAPARMVQVQDTAVAQQADPAAVKTEPRDMTEGLQLRSEDGSLELRVPASIALRLRSYQIEGVQFLFRQYAHGIGGILADDMGLGKTLQTVAFLSALLGKNDTLADDRPRALVAGRKRFPILIVVPPTLLDNWANEFELWGSFRICMYHGSKKHAASNAIGSGHAEIMLAGYETYRIDHKVLQEIAWHAVVFDEAHRLKNEGTQIYQAASSLSTKLRFLLTGTVMQNNYEELWNILNYAVPGSLGERKEFVNYYTEPLKKARQLSAKAHVLEKGQERQERLQRLLAKYLLRRRKDNTIPDQLPQKTDNIVFCKMTRLQSRAYKRVLSSPELLRLQASFDTCTCDSGLRGSQCCYKGVQPGGMGPLWRQYHDCQCDYPYHPRDRPDGCKWHKPDGCGMCPICITLPALTILKKISNHLDLVKADLKECGDDRKKLARQEAVAAMCLGEDAEEVGGVRSNETWFDQQKTNACGKLQALQMLLTLWSRAGENNKVLLFSNSTKMLDRIESIVTVKGYAFSRLDGSTERSQRQKLVNSFNQDASTFLFLISTLAGGVGLNLTSANKVIIMDPSWNPAADMQAIDRAYRIGTKRDVNVYRFVSAGTIEEIMYSRQVYKQQQSNVAVENMQEPRYFDAIQKDRGIGAENGELFGLENLFKLTAQKVNICEIVEEPKTKELPFHIQEVKSSDFAHIKLEPGDQAGELGVTEEDSGLNDLAREMTRRSQQAASQHIPSGEAAIIRGNGVMRSMRHDQILGEQGLSKQATNKARQAKRIAPGHTPLKTASRGLDIEAAQTSTSKPARARQACTDVPTQPAAKTALESLALWKGLDVLELASQLFQMTAHERDSLRSQYAMALANERHGPLHMRDFPST